MASDAAGRLAARAWPLALSLDRATLAIARSRRFAGHTDSDGVKDASGRNATSRMHVSRRPRQLHVLRQVQRPGPDSADAFTNVNDTRALLIFPEDGLLFALKDLNQSVAS